MLNPLEWKREHRAGLLAASAAGAALGVAIGFSTRFRGRGSFTDWVASNPGDTLFWALVGAIVVGAAIYSYQVSRDTGVRSGENANATVGAFLEQQSEPTDPAIAAHRWGAPCDLTTWQALKRAFDNFWNPTPELRAAMELPRFTGAWFKATWKASHRWPVIWRRLVVIFVAIQLWNVGYLAARGFQTVVLERQRQAAEAGAMAGFSYADAAGTTANERAQRIARYCQWLKPELMDDVEMFLSTSEEFRTLKQFKCWK